MWMNFYYHTRKERICQQIRNSIIIYYIGLTYIGSCSIMKAR